MVPLKRFRIRATMPTNLAPLAQLVEQRPLKATVAGSTPARGTFSV
jgi:hypothetical protein